MTSHVSNLSFFLSDEWHGRSLTHYRYSSTISAQQASLLSQHDQYEENKVYSMQLESRRLILHQFVVIVTGNAYIPCLSCLDRS